jgi:hypothetical protein
LANFSYSAELSEQLLQHGIITLLVRLLQMLMASSSGQTGKLVNRVGATVRSLHTKFVQQFLWQMHVPMYRRSPGTQPTS